MAPGAGIEPAISALTGRRCTTQLPRNNQKTGSFGPGFVILRNKNSPSPEPVIIVISVILAKILFHNFSLTKAGKLVNCPPKRF